MRASEEPVRTAFFGFNGVDFRGELEANTSPAAYALAFEIIENSERGAQFPIEFLMVSWPEDYDEDPGTPTFKVVLRNGRELSTAWRPTESVEEARAEGLRESARSAEFLGLKSSMTADEWRPWNPANYSSMWMAATEVSLALQHGRARNPGVPMGEINEDDIKVICAGCDKFLRGRPDAPLTSHGVCKETAEECWEKGAERQRQRRAAELEREQGGDVVRNAFLAKPEGKHHGPVAGGVHPYPGFHTSRDEEVAVPYAQMKVEDDVDAPDDECEECEGSGCPECASAYSLPDYPVVIAVDMQGLTPEPDYDAIHLSMDVLRQTAAEALEHGGDDPVRWLDSLEALDPGEAPDSTMGALFYRFASTVQDPSRGLLNVLEDVSPDEAARRLQVIVEGGDEAEVLAMQVIGQFRYTQDVSDDRLVSVDYMKPFWPHGVVDLYESEDMVEALGGAGWDVVTDDDLERFDASMRTVWERKIRPGARIEYHGTSYRNLLLAAPWLKGKLPEPPAPYRAAT